MKKILFVLVFVILFLSFTSAFDWNDDTLNAYYDLDETSGSTIIDSLYAKNGTLNATVTSVAGVIGTGQQAGQDRWAYIPDLTHANGTNWTFNVWATSNATSIQTGRLWSQNTTTYQSYLTFTPNNITFDIKSTTGSTNSIRYDDTYTTGTYYMLTFQIVNNASGMCGEIWVNGTNVNTSCLAGNTSQGATATRLFKLQEEQFFTGWIDEWGFWNRTLSASEISELYNDGNGLPYGNPGGITVNLNVPSDSSSIDDDPITFNSSMVPSDFSLVNATLYLWFNNGTLYNTSTNTSFTGNYSIVSLDAPPIADYVWNVLGVQGNGNGSNSSFSTSNYSFSFIPFENVGEQYVNESYETDNETFYINISTIGDVSNLGAFLNYNGSRYAATHSCSNNLCQIQSTIDLPLVNNQGASSENKTWFWQITVFGDSFGTFSSNTSSHQQNVTNIAIMNSTFPLGINFTIHNETNLSYFQIADFKSTMTYHLGGGSVTENYNFSGVGLQTYSFNLSHNLTFYTTSEIEIQNGSDEREYYFLNELLTNTTTDRKLFIPDTSISNIIIEVKDQGLIPLEDIIVNVSRYYPDLDLYEQVENQKTDEFGQFVAKLVQNDVKYKFAFYNANGVLLKTSDRISIACRSTICILPFVIESEDGYFDRYENTTLFSYSLSFDNTTNTFTYSWDDQTGVGATYRLEVTRYNLNQSALVCNTTSTATVASLTCAVGDSSATYKAQVYRMVTGDDERRVSLLNIVIGSPTATYGVEGLVWAFVLLFTCIAIGAFNPTAGIVLYGTGFILLGVMGLIAMPLGVFFANTLICILFAWAVNT